MSNKDGSTTQAEIILAIYSFVLTLFDIDLQNSYGVSKPEELIKEMIDNPAEYDDFAVFVQSYNGFDISLSEKVEQAKNS